MKKVLIIGFMWGYHTTGREDDNRVRKVLIITYLYASPRIPGLAKYLPEFGWQPVVLTAPLPVKPELKCQIIETPYSHPLDFWMRLFKFKPDESIRAQVNARLGISSKNGFTRFLFTRLREIVAYPDMERDWKSSALEVASGLMPEGGIDAIISSSSPVTSHIIANELKDRYKIPWLADFRDLWSQNHNYRYSPVRRALDRRLELKTLSKADALVTVSQPWAAKLRVLHKGKPVYQITNGFDHEEINDPPAELAPGFIITYTGTIYQGKQNPWKLLVALRELFSDGMLNPDEVQVKFYGSGNWVKEESQEYGLSGIVKHYGMIPRHDTIRKQRESELLLLLDWDDLQEKGVYPLKIFEYLAALRPILATGGVAGNVVDVLLGKTNAGVHTPTVEDIKSALMKFYEDYKLTGKVAHNGLNTEINKYTHREMASRFAQILNSLG